ncbi:MAG: hypothetical protein F6J97_11475, partial [Leptolyngbya sp. SIO4C1]|nr:hypothetical protein [Leptolyngbya sp. SIO4C1]
SIGVILGWLSDSCACVRIHVRLYGHFSAPHSHVNCVDTNQIIDIDIQLPEELLRQVEAKTGVRITDYRVDFFGTSNSTGK